MDKEKPEHLKYYESLKPEESDTRKNALDDHVTIEHKWTTPFFEMEGVLPQKMRDDLCRVLEKKELDMKIVKEKEPEFYSIAQAKGFYATTHYNLFAEEDMSEFPDEKESIVAYEKLAMQQIRYYIRKGWGVQQADDMRLEGRCFGNVQSASDQQGGARTYPHYHQDMNGVLVHYLRMGDEDVSLENQLQVGQEQSSRHGSHQVLFQDPRPSINYPFWEKIYAVSPRVGLTLIHPNYLWHETNPWLGKGTRVVIVVNFRIMSHGYNELSKSLRG